MTLPAPRTIWLLTMADDDDATSPRLENARAVGVDAIHVPFVQRTPLPWPTQGAAATPEANALLFVTSPFSARRIIQEHNRWPQLPTIAALAPTTAQTFQAAGINPLVRATGGAAALATAVVSSPHIGARASTVVWPTSAQALTQPEHQEATRILKAVAQVVSFAAYSTLPHPALRESLGQFSRQLTNVVLFSPSAVDAARVASELGWARFGSVACVGTSTSRRWREVTSEPASDYANFDAWLSATESPLP